MPPEDPMPKHKTDLWKQRNNEAYLRDAAFAQIDVDDIDAFTPMNDD